MILFLLSTFILIPFCVGASTNAPLAFTGKILYSPIQSPATAPTGENFAVIPGKWGDYDILGYINGEAGIFHLDTAVTHNGNPSIRQDYPRQDDSANEVNSAYIQLEPGDHVYCCCWIKTEPDTVGNGAIFGMDLYGPLNRLWEVHPRTADWTFTIPQPGHAIYVPYGRDWIFVEFEFDVPTSHFRTDDYGTPITPQYVCGAIPWLGASWGNGETSSVWWSEYSIYVNP